MATLRRCSALQHSKINSERVKNGGAFYIDCLPMLKNGGGATAPLAPPVPPPMKSSDMDKLLANPELEMV